FARWTRSCPPGTARDVSAALRHRTCTFAPHRLCFPSARRSSMKTFPLCGPLALMAALALAAAAPAADSPHHHDAMMKCAKACAACQLECDSCLAHCKHLLSEGKKEHAPT